MTKKRKTLLNFSLMFVLFSLTIYVIFKNNDLEDVISEIKNGDKNLLLLAGCMMIVSLLCESIMIYILLKCKKEKVHFLRCAKYSFIGFYYCAITPSASGGQPAQILYMKKDGYKVTTTSVIILTLVTVYKAVLLGFVVITHLFNHSFVKDNINNLTPFYLLGVTINTLFIVFIWLLIFKPQIVNWIIKLLSVLVSKNKLIKNSKKIISSLNNMMEDYVESTSFIKNNLILLLPILFFTILQRLLMFSISYVVYKFFGLSQYSFFEILTLQIILNTSVDSLPIPGGIGASEVAFKMIYKCAYNGALLIPAMLVTRFINFYFMLIFSAFISLTAHYLMIRNDFRKDNLS